MSDNLGPAPGATNSTSTADSGPHEIAASGQPKPSTSKLAAVGILTGQTYTHGVVTSASLFDPANVSLGENYWGVPDSALPLEVTLSAANDKILYPENNSFYDVNFWMSIQGDAADAGKPVHINVAGNNYNVAGTIVLKDDGSGRFADFFVDQSFLTDTIGDPGAGIQIEVDCTALTVDALPSGGLVMVIQRA